MPSTLNEKRVAFDVTGVGHHEARDRFKASLQVAGWSFHEYDKFWEHFPKQVRSLPNRLVVVADLAILARHYRDQDRHDWIASVRKSLLYFLVLVRTQEDERQAAVVDELVRYSDFRISVCRSKRDTDLRTCVVSALSAFDPTALATVRFDRGGNGLWVEFGDGFSGFVSWEQLGMAAVVDRIIRESATIGSYGKTIELTQANGSLFEIDSGSVRAVLDAAYQHQVQERSLIAAQDVGHRVRAARLAARLTQAQLGERSGIDQALLSKLERGQHQPRFDTLKRIAENLGVTVAQLLQAEFDTPVRRRNTTSRRDGV